MRAAHSSVAAGFWDRRAPRCSETVTGRMPRRTRAHVRSSWSPFSLPDSSARSFRHWFHGCILRLWEGKFPCDVVLLCKHGSQGHKTSLFGHNCWLPLITSILELLSSMKLLILKEGGSFRSGWRTVLEQEKQTHIAAVCQWILLADTAGENGSFRKASIQPSSSNNVLWLSF